MKKLIYSLIALAGLFTLASCQPDKLIGGSAAAGEGTVNATFCVELGPQTKAIADGTTADKLYAGIYEVSGTTYTWVADNADAPVAISAKTASVTFNGKIELGKSYKVVFWAQKQDAPYAIDWAKSAATGPAVTVTATGEANDEARDAFFGVYETGTVTGSIDLTGSPVSLKRPFAQVNVLVPNDNVADLTAAVTSSMTVAQAPTVLNLVTKETSDPADWTFSAAAISEAAFGTYASTHKYVAMNYILVDQTAPDARYDVTFSVTSGTQSVDDKALANIPLKPNGRTNIVGNIFDANFDLTIPVIVDPGVGTEQELTSVTVSVGQNPGNAVELDAGYNADPTQRTAIPIEVAVSHPVEVEADKPQITVNPATVATAEWNLTTGKLDVTPLVPNGAASITLVFPSVTKTEYSAATVQLFVRVGNGINTAATPTFDPVAGEVAANSQVEISTTTPGAKIYYTKGDNPADPTAQSTLYEGPITITEATTIKAIAIKEGFSNSAVATAAYTIAAKPTQTLTVKVGDDTVGATLDKTFGDADFNITVTGNEGGLTYESATPSVATISDGGAIHIVGAGSSIITVTAAETGSYAETSKLITLIVAKKAADLVLDDDEAAVTAGETVYVPYAVESDGVISVSSSDEAKATASVDTQNERIVINGVAAGSATLTVSIAAGNNYLALSQNQTITVTVTVPDFTTVVELKALLGNESASFTGTLTDAVVSFIAGTSDAVIKDATGSILYHKESGHGLLQGQTISGDVIAEAVIYNGINEITDLAATVEGEESAVEPEVVTFAQLAADYATYESAYVKVVGATSNTTTTKKGNIEATQDGTNYIVYTNVAIPVNTGDVFTAEGTVTKYNTTEELKVWKAADLTVTAAAPVLSATPAATTVAATATSVTWTISSNTDWTITPGTGVTASVTSGNGNADVTLTFAANTGSEAATYTATVSATGCDDVTITITQSAAGSSSDITDTITSALLTATSTTYTDFSNVAATSSARYAGNSAKSSSGGIQMRSKNSNSGIVSTVSGGRVKSVTITVESGDNDIDVYGNNTAYTGAGDLYATGEGANQGTKIGTLNATGTITFTDDYAYVGIRSNNGAIYVTSVEIVWE